MLGLIGINGRCCLHCGLRAATHKSALPRPQQQHFPRLPSSSGSCSTAVVTINRTFAHLPGRGFLIPSQKTPVSHRRMHSIVELWKRIFHKQIIAKNVGTEMKAVSKQPAKKLKLSDIRELAKLMWPWRARIGGGLLMLYITLPISLSLPRVLGKMLDYAKEQPQEEGQEQHQQELMTPQERLEEVVKGEKVAQQQEPVPNIFDRIAQFFPWSLSKKQPKEQEEQELAQKERLQKVELKEGAKQADIFDRMARFFRQNPWYLAAPILVSSCAMMARIYLMHTAAQKIVNDLRTNIFRSIIRQDIAFFDRNKVGEIVSRLSSDAFMVGNSLSSNFGNGTRALFQILGTTGMMAYTSPELSARGALIIPCVAGFFYVSAKYQREYTRRMQETIAATNQLATERFMCVRTIRAFGAEEKELKNYRQQIDQIWDVSWRDGRLNAMIFSGLQLLAYGFMAYFYQTGSNLIHLGLLSYGDLSAFFIYAVLCFNGIQTLQGFYSELMRSLAASERLFEFRDMKPQIPLTGGLKITDLKREIRFESVAFAYPARETIFNDVTFRIPVASTTAIVGPSGCGKSTIAHLLLRLYSPTQGRIVVDDHDLRELDPSAWRKLIGTVSQEPVLFSTTIKENILYGVDENTRVTEEELYEAARLSNCLEFIESLPNGFDTMVGEQGASMLSGGQRQRIAIARALIKKPRILILDEATSALDATSEYLVRKALEVLLAKNGQTVLIIAHRLSTIKHADQIVVLDTGTVAELGTFEGLMSIEDGIFRKLVEKQTFHWRDDQF